MWENVQGHVLPGLKNSVIFRLGSLLLLIVLLITGLNVGWALRQVSDQTLVRQSEDALARLEGGGRSLDLTLEQIALSMSGVIFSEPVRQLLVSGGVGNSGLLYQSVLTVQALVTEQPAALDAYLYADSSGLLLAKGGRQAEEDFRPQLAEFAALTEPPQFHTNHNHTWVRWSQGRLWLVQELFYSRRVCLLCLELDPEYLLRHCLLGTEAIVAETALGNGDGTAWGLDGQTLQVPTQAARICESVPSGRELRRLPADSWYCYSLPQSGLLLWQPLSPSAASLKAAPLLPVLLPSLLLLALFVAFFTSYLYRQLYRPLNRLLALAQDNPAPADPAPAEAGQTEFDCLNHAYRRLQWENVQAQELLRGASATIEKQLLTDLLQSGGQPTPALSALSGLSSPFGEPGLFVLRLFAWPEAAGNSVSALERALCLRNVEEKLAAGLSSEQAGRWLQISGSLVELVKFPPETPPATVTAWLVGEQARLLAALAGQPCSLLLLDSETCREPEMLPERYCRLLDRLHYFRYSGGPEQQAGPLLLVAGDNRPQGLSQQELADICKAALEGQEKKSRQLLSELGRREGAEVWPQAREYFSQQLIRRRLDCPTEADGEHFCHAALTALAEYGAGSEHRFIQSAQEYIQAHYSDGSLALTDVSEAIGCSAGYLSKLFSAEIGQTFSRWLNAYRLEQAQRLLKETDISIEEIGFHCGFNYRQNFSRAFRAYTGSTASDYRWAQRQERRQEPIRQGENRPTDKEESKG